MSRKRDPNMPIGKITEIENFLPPPEKLIFPKKTVKVTLNLSTASVMFLKLAAVKHHTKYQKLIREIVDRYAGRYAE